MMKLVKTVASALTLATTLGAQAAPVVNLFELGIRQGQAVQYDEVGKHNITTSINTEQGTLAMYSMKQKAQPNMAYMFEIYADEQAYQTHIQSAQYKVFLQASPTILTDHKKRISLEPQFLAEPDASGEGAPWWRSRRGWCANALCSAAICGKRTMAACALAWWHSGRSWNRFNLALSFRSFAGRSGNGRFIFWRGG